MDNVAGIDAKSNNVLIQRGGVLGSFFRPSATGEDRTVVSSSFRKAREFSETPSPPRIYGEASILRQNASLPHHSFFMRIQREGGHGGQDSRIVVLADSRICLRVPPPPEFPAWGLGSGLNAGLRRHNSLGISLKC